MNPALPENSIVCANCIPWLAGQPAEWADLVFADPPFNIGFKYDGYDDARPVGEYLDFSERWMAAVHRALKPDGSFYLAIGDDFAADLCVIARRKLGFKLRNWIVWHYTFGQSAKSKFARSHTHILYFAKGDQFTFNADSIRVPSARQTVYADKRGNPAGKLPDDVWYLRPQETPPEMFAADGDTWNESRVCGTFKERAGWHGCQMPLAIMDRIVKVSSDAGGMVLDPFAGSGTTCVAAARLGRKFIGIEIGKKYAALARKRIDDAMERKA